MTGRVGVRELAVLAAVLLVSLLAACGGDDGAGGGSDVSDVSEQQVIDALDLVPSGGNYATADGRCEIATVLTGEDEISLYKDAGDPVAANGDGTVGVKVFADAPSVSDEDCVDELSAKLDDAF